jgi:glycosyltransferase involved in cell wall biosynthesis
MGVRRPPAVPRCVRHLELPNFDCFVLPSYYNEGTPRSLLEASSTALPIITTDWKGCRDVVVDGVSGLLCRPRDAKDLADKMAYMAGLSSAKRVSMGAQGRQRIIDAFSDQRIIERYLSAFPADLGNRQRPGHVR